MHAVELDRSLEPHLASVEAAQRRAPLAATRSQLDLGALDPPPAKLVANLPYNIATPLVVESLDGLPSVELWCVMVQREVADRFFAAPGTKAYGAVSVLMQLAAERTGFHPVSRDGLPPAAERRLGAGRVRAPPAAVPTSQRSSAPSTAAFAHRRKTPRELARALRPRDRGSRRRPRSRRSAATRARVPRRSAPPEFVALAQELAR